jgi:endonuclease/exonuclease/phosphatase family metal-dependent hydrolase
MVANLKIMCWNIAEGRRGRPNEHNVHIPAIANEIHQKAPDIVLLNETLNYDMWIGGWIGGRIRQSEKIAELTQLPFVQWGQTDAMGWVAHKAVAVLSRYPLGTSQVHPVMNNGQTTGYAILQTSANVDGSVHHLFTTRFDAHHEDANISAHIQAAALVQALPSGDPVIFGGDFNANRAQDPQFHDFERATGLLNAFYAVPDPTPCEPNPQKLIDHVFYRGPYKVGLTEVRCPWGGQPNELSEHPWVYVDLVSAPGAVATTVPDVTGMTEDEATQLLKNRELLFGGGTLLGLGALRN